MRFSIAIASTIIRVGTIACALSAPANTLAHKDTPFVLLADGTLSGVPEEFEPASLVVDLVPPEPTVIVELSGVK